MWSASAPALAAGLLFAVHPVHSQAVNYLSSRSETMCMALVMWALVLLQARHGIWSAVIYAGALLTKSTAVARKPAAEIAAPKQLWPGMRRCSPGHFSVGRLDPAQTAQR